MLWIFVLALIMPISLGTCDDTNLAKVTWGHAVNSQDKLKTALADDKLQMIEADVILGELEAPAQNKNGQSQPAPPAPATGAEIPEAIKPEENKPAQTAQQAQPAAEDNKAPAEQKPAGAQDAAAAAAAAAPAPANKEPVMGHPPDNSSDLSLAQFLDAVVKHNSDTKSPKGVKLDFKSIDALKSSMGSFVKTKDLKAPLWINADIIVGPNKEAGDEVNAKEFFDAIHASKDLVNKTLSIGWTTELGNDATSYNETHVEAMVKAIEANKIPVGYPITFPVRAAIAAHSKDSLKKLFETVGKDNRQVTFTIWSGDKDTDKVDHAKLQEFINEFGLSKVYVDVPKDLESKLQLGNSAVTLAKFGLLNLVAIAFAMFFRNGLH